MAKHKNYLQIILIMGSFSLLSLFGCNGSRSVGGNSVIHGPFTIKSKTRTSSRFDVNTASRRRDTVTSYQVLFNGKPLPFPAGTAYDNLWKVYLLPGAPTTTLLTAGRSAYLWSEKDGELLGKQIIEVGSDFLSLQWLDVEGDMPDPQWTLYRSDDRKSSIELTAGDHLLIGQEQLLRISDLQLFSIPRKKRLIDDFYPRTSQGAQALSPDKQQIVMLGSKSDEIDRTKYHYGFMVYNYQDGGEYALQIDQNATRLPECKLVNPNWFKTYYEWQELTEGGYKLVEKELASLPAWQGWFNDPSDKRFQLQPVSKDLLPLFADFVREQLSLPAEALKEEKSESFEYFHFVYEEKRFTMSFWAEGQHLSFSVNLLERGNERTNQIVTAIGEAFNAELAKKKYESYFTSM